jgi:hypothetical protein
MTKLITPFILILLFAFHAFSQTLPVPVVNDQLVPALSVKLSGHVGEKLDASYQNRILAQDVDRLVAPFRNRTETSCWQSEFWGKWFTSAMLAYHYKPEPRLKTKLDQAVTGLISTQTPDGYIGNYADDRRLASWDIWGRKYCMLGLLSYYDLTKDKNSLEAASKVADHLMKELQDRNVLLVKMGSHRGMAASSVLEPICQLYARTGDKKYLGFAQEIVRQWETPDGPQLISKSNMPVSERFPKPTVNWYGWEQGQKAYEMMSCYEGLLELYRLTGKEEFKRAVERTWDSIRESEINVAGSGSSMECWFHGEEHQTHPVYHYQETCVTATWVKLNQQLLRLTGEAKYADAIEQTYYNALLGSMNHDGSDWAKYTPLTGQRLEGGEQCGMGLNCCVASGPRGLFTLPLTAVMGYNNGVKVNFYVPGSYSVLTPGKQTIKVIQETDYPETGKIRIKVESQKDENMTFQFRIPEWSTLSTLTVNGTTISGLKPGSFAEVKRNWKSGDLVDLAFDMRGRIIRQGESPVNTAIMRGPVLLSRDARLSGPTLESVISPVADKNGFIELVPEANKKQGIWMEFKASFMPEAYTEGGPKPIFVNLCDYASAGNAREDHPYFKVWLPQLYNPRD